jgi:ribonuclease P protein component
VDDANAAKPPGAAGGAKFTFRPHEHLRRPADFQRVYDRRRSVSNEFLIVYACPNGLPHLRLGLSVSRKVGGAVRRNRLRRLFREAFRLTRHLMPAGLDLVLIPRGPAVPRLASLAEALPKLVGQVARKLARDAAKDAEAPPP